MFTRAIFIRDNINSNIYRTKINRIEPNPYAFKHAQIFYARFIYISLATRRGCAQIASQREREKPRSTRSALYMCTYTRTRVRIYLWSRFELRYAFPLTRANELAREGARDGRWPVGRSVGRGEGSGHADLCASDKGRLQGVENLVKRGRPRQLYGFKRCTVCVRALLPMHLLASHFALRCFSQSQFPFLIVSHGMRDFEIVASQKYFLK